MGSDWSSWGKAPGRRWEGGSSCRDPPSLADPEPVGDGPVSFRVPLTQILEEPAPLADQHEQASAGMMILLMRLEVVREAVDALRQERDLDLGGSGVPFVSLE